MTVIKRNRPRSLRVKVASFSVPLSMKFVERCKTCTEVCVKSPERALVKPYE